MNKTPIITVTGAEISGLFCSENLRGGAFDIFVFDKTWSQVGRMSTHSGDGWQCDHGAQYFTARDPGSRAEVARWQAAGPAPRTRQRTIRTLAHARRHRRATARPGNRNPLQMDLDF